jgi:pilus assembly protein Flp/PilA
MVSTRHLVCFLVLEGIHMKTLATIASRFRQEEDGAAMIEYTVLLGLITVAVVVTVGAVGVWVSGKWTSLCSAVGATNCTAATTG